MENLVLELIASYEQCISRVESLINGAYQSAISPDETLPREQGEMLRESLRETLAWNCSLRRKDFNRLMARIFARIEDSRRELEKERALIRARLADYMAGQREALIALRYELMRVDQESADGIGKQVARIRYGYGSEGDDILSKLNDFQLRLEALRREQQVLNSELRRLLERGESLRLQDIKRLEAAREPALFQTAAPGREVRTPA